MNQKRKMWPIFFVILAFFAVTSALALWRINHRSHSLKNVQLTNGTVIYPAEKLPSIHLTDSHNHDFTNASLKGHWSLLFFGFTRCPMICPTTLAELNKAYKLIEQQHIKRLPTVVFITVDPERDSPEAIKTYLSHFNSHFIGASGTKQSIAKFAAKMGVAYMKSTKSGETDYTMSHTDSIMVINPKGEWTAVLSSPHDANNIAQNYIRLKNAY